MCTFDAGPGRDQAEHAVVGHDDGREARTHRVGDRGIETREHGLVVFAAGRLGDLAPPPRVAHPGPALVDLVAGRPLPLAAAALAQAGMPPVRRVERRRR